MNDEEFLISDHFKSNLVNLKPLTLGYCNKLWRLDLKTGVFIIKKYNSKLNSAFNSSLKVQSYLSNFGVSPQIKELIFNGVDKKQKYSIQKYVETDKTSDKTSNFFIGENLGKLHKLLNPCKVKVKLVSNDLDFVCKTKNKRSNYLYNLKIDILKKLNNFDETFLKGTKQIIHGDYSKRNLIFSNKGIQTIDFDECKYYFRCYELVKEIVNILICPWESNFIKFTAVSDFLHGYMQINYINENDFNNMFNLYAFTLACNQTGLTDHNDAFKSYNSFLNTRITQHEFVLKEFENIKKIMLNLKSSFY